MRTIHKLSKIIRRPIIARRREQIYSVVPPTEGAGKFRYRHDFQNGHAKVCQRRQLLHCSLPIPLRGQRPHVQLINDLPFNTDSGPIVICPIKFRCIYKLGRSMRTTRLESRSRIGKRSLSINKKSIRIAGPCPDHVSGKVSPATLRQKMFGSVDNNRHAFVLICPNSQMSSRVVDLSSHRIPPREGRALYRFFKHSVSDTTTMDCVSLFTCPAVTWLFAPCVWIRHRFRLPWRALPLAKAVRFSSN